VSPSMRYVGTLPRIRAVLAHRTLYELGAELQPQAPVGRPCTHPAYVLLLFATLSRITRSSVRLETDLQDPDLWRLVRSQMLQTIEREHLDVPPPGKRPPACHHWRRLRDDHLATDEGLAQIGRLHLPGAVALAQRLGLLNPNGKASLTHPDASRAVYGDGTIVRPLYAPPRTVHTVDDHGESVTMFVNPTTGLLEPSPSRRYDADIALHRGHAGPALGHGYVAWHARGPGHYQRVVLHLGHIDQPGGEAHTALQLLGDIHRAVGRGIQVVIYDGAFRGAHIDHVMTKYGYLAIAKQPAFTDEELATTRSVKTRSGKRATSIPLGIAAHLTPHGQCHHTLAAIRGAVVELDLDEGGDPVVLNELKRGPVKRARRQHGQYHFNVSYRIPCPFGEFDTWLSPHAKTKGDPTPEGLRVFPETDSDALRLRGLRSDAEAVHSMFKRTLLVDRAMSLGWRRGLLEYYAFAWYTNALAEDSLRSKHSERTERALLSG
jgi:hypothetical protein